MAARSKEWVYDQSLVGNACSNPARGVDICLLCVLCLVTLCFLRRAHQPARGVLPSAGILRVIVKARKMRRPWRNKGCRARGGGIYDNPMNIGLSGEAKVFPVQAMKAYKRNANIATLSLNLDITWKLGHSSFTSAK